MIVSMLAAVALSQAQPALLDELRLVASHLALAQACEVVERTTIKWDDFGAYAEGLARQADEQGLNRQSVNDHQEQGYSEMMQSLEALLPEGRDSPNLPQLYASCDNLMRERPQFFIAYSPQD